MKVLCVQTNTRILRSGANDKAKVIEGKTYKVTGSLMYDGREFLELNNDTSAAFSWKYFIPLSNICEKKILKERVLNAINTFKL